jgi:DNA polymerase-3 subunit epsilon
MLGFDLETTGVDPEQARIVTATAIAVHGRDVHVREWLVNPGVTIPAEATAVHGVTTQHAAEHGRVVWEAVSEIAAVLRAAWGAATPVVIFNAPYDLTVVDRELRRHQRGQLSVDGPVIDPYCIDKRLDRFRKGSRKLDAMCAHYGVKLEGAHSSTGDALAACRLAWRLAQVFPDELSAVEKLNELQAAWRAEWAIEFTKYLRKQGKDEPVDGSWPLRPAAA